MKTLLLVLSEICKLPVDVGKCSNSLTRYHYDPLLGECRQFVYGGCHGNANRFLTYADCESTCQQVLQPADDDQYVEGRPTSVSSIVITLQGGSH